MLMGNVKEIRQDRLKSISDAIRLKMVLDRKIATAKLTPSQTLLLSIQEKQRLSIKQLANLVDIPIATTRKLLLGLTRDPQISTFNKILLAYSKLTNIPSNIPSNLNID